MNEELIDELLYRSEGVDLDFKRAQYPFAGSKDEDKRSELLKDILAMANSWRDRTAYILLGFQEDKPNLPQVTGINEHLDDASLQQFVSSKVHPPLEFRYEEFSYKGKHIAVISIPKQTRPFYVKSTYGKVHSNVVYVRRGSSTAEAEPPEISRMMATDAGALRTPSVELTFIDRSGVSLQGDFKFERVEFESIEDLPTYKIPRVPGFGIGRAMSLNLVNSSYWRELAEYVEDFSGSLRLRARLVNHSSFAMSDCKLKFAATNGGRSVVMKTALQMRRRPSTELSHLTHIKTLSEVLGEREGLAEFYIEEDRGQTSCILVIPKLLPGETFNAPQYFSVFPLSSGELTITAKLYATELSTPIVMQSIFNVEVKSKAGDMELLERIG